ncbi:MAG: hypothetical protein GY696_16465, partial [Gammaproteobacteria bacterium]|nr:hypothetical protein [Gammaproteobacteria bacterium]
MGIFCPIILNGKLFIQRLWKTKLTWDQTLPQALVNEFTQVAEELRLISGFPYPRHLPEVSVHEMDHDLVCCVDGSNVAYAA